MTPHTSAAENTPLVILHRETHGHLKLNRAAPDYGFARESVTVALTVGELPAACAEYPCVMARQPDGALSLLAVTGLQAGHNLFVGADGAWLGQYLPATLATWPFRLVRESDDGRFLVAVRPDSLNASVGDPLFNAQGQESPWLLERLRQLTETDAGLSDTAAQLAQLEAAGVLTERSLQAILPDGRDLELHGFLTVDEARLQALPEKTVHALHTSGALSLAYLHLLSLRQFRQLVLRSGEQAQRLTEQAPPVVQAPVIKPEHDSVADLPVSMLPA
jgi:SapC